MKKMKSYRLSDQALSSLAEIRAHNPQCSDTEIIEKAIELLNAVEVCTEEFNKIKYRTMNGDYLKITFLDF